ncbi:MAG: serine/threonine-protein kinase [Acidobacteriota bacterium]|nr:serine/threonine-protein kinase [Acidobacteriota bacterium]
MLFTDHLLGKYKIVSTIGSGGFGTVYLAEDTWINKRVALKVPHRQNLNFSELLREPRLLASLDHPNIVSITTAEKEDNVFFIVMEYVQGDTLEAVIGAGGRLDVDKALDYAVQITLAVEHAHTQGIIHRDLRPANVLVSNAGTLKVADFGTSRFLEIAAHGTTVIGSPPYMAPEQFRGEAVFASDLYSLGITVYQMLTGVLPYDTPAPHDLDRLRRGELVRPPHLLNSAIPTTLDAVVMKAVSPEVTDRYQRAGELLADLHDIRTARRVAPAAAASGAAAGSPPAGSRLTDTPERGLHARLRSRATPASTFCWQCRKPLHARADRCPFCGETQ